MVGPRKKKMPGRKVCDECDSVLSRTLGGTERFPKKRTVNYCTNFVDKGVSFIKGYPYTPAWCPALKGQNNQESKPKQLAKSEMM